MANLTICDIEDDLKKRLRVRAAEHGRSPEAEARAILNEALAHGEEPRTKMLGNLVAELFGPDNGFDLEAYLPKRGEMRDPPGLVHDHS